GVAAVALTYVIVRPRFGPLAALSATALFATAPWAVLYSRKIWPQDLLPIVCVLLLGSLFRVLERTRSRAVLFVPVLLCLTFQLHFSAVALIVPTAGVVLYRARRVNWPALGAGVVIAALLLAPYAYHELTHRLEDVRLLATAGSSPTRASAVLTAFRWMVWLVGALGWGYMTGSSDDAFASYGGWQVTLGKVVSAPAAALLLGSALY